MASHFHYSIKNEGLFKVTGGHVHRKSGNIWETVQDKRCCYSRSPTGNVIM